MRNAEHFANSHESRRPLIDWYLNLKVDKTLEKVQTAFDEFHHGFKGMDQKFQEAQWSEQPKEPKLGVAIRTLVPTLWARIKTVLHQNPQRLPAILIKLAKSGAYFCWWRTNNFLMNRWGRCPNKVKSTKSILVQRWLSVLIDVHEEMEQVQASSLRALKRKRKKKGDTTFVAANNGS